MNWPEGSGMPVSAAEKRPPEVAGLLQIYSTDWPGARFVIAGGAGVQSGSVTVQLERVVGPVLVTRTVKGMAVAVH